MGRRHALNNTAKSYFTSWEKKEAGYGTKTERLGTDSKLPFGHCWLGLQVAVEPMVSPSGHIYSKEAIYQYLLEKQEELARARALWEKEQKEIETEEAMKQLSEAQKKVEEFVRTEESVSRKRTRKPDEEAEFQEKQKKFLYAPHKAGELVADPKSKKQKRDDLKRTSFWLPEFTPSNEKRRMQKPRKRPGSPITNRPLRLKDLTPVKLKVLPGTEKGEKKFVCMVSQKEITYQDTVFLKNTGVVMLKSCFEQLAKPSMTCPVTGKPFKKKHVIVIKNDGSGYAATGNVIAKKWSEALMN